MAFISAAEGTLQAKHDEIWRCIHCPTDTANIPHRISLPLALQTLDQLPAISWDLSYCTGIPLMFTFGPESYDFQTWSTTGDGDYLLGNDTWATNLLSCKLACMAGRTGPDDPSPIRAASPASLAGSAIPLFPAHSPSRSHSRTPIHKTGKERSCYSSASSTHSQETKPKSPLASDGEDSNDGDSASQEGNKSEEKDEADSDSGAPDDGKGSDSGSSDGEGSGGGGKISDADGQDKDCDGETNESNSETEESDAESSSSSSESDDETLTKATPSTKKTPESNPNTSQMLSLPDLDSKDLMEKWKIQWHRDDCLLDEKFGTWQDQMISKGQNEWKMHDTMTYDHADPCNEAKFPDLIGPPLEYMKHCRVFSANKTNEYDLPCKPATCEWVSKFLQMARSLGWPNLIVAHLQDSVMAICLLQELPIKNSLQCLLMEPKADAAGKAVKKLSFCLFCMYSGSIDPLYMNHIICGHYNVNYRCRKCLKEVITTGQPLNYHMKVCKSLPKEVANEASMGDMDHTPTTPEKKCMSKDPSPRSWPPPPQSSQGSSQVSLCQSQHAKRSPLQLLRVGLQPQRGGALLHPQTSEQGQIW